MREYVLYSAKLEREDKFLAIGAQGRSPASGRRRWPVRRPVCAPAKPAFPPSMAVAVGRISCHAVAAQPAQRAGLQQPGRALPLSEVILRQSPFSFQMNHFPRQAYFAMVLAEVLAEIRGNKQGIGFILPASVRGKVQVNNAVGGTHGPAVVGLVTVETEIHHIHFY